MKDELIKSVNKLANEDKYVVLDNFKTDFRKMRELSDKEISLAKDGNNQAAELLEKKIKEYCEYCISHGIPFDTIDVVAEPGLVLNCDKYRELMKSYVDYNYGREKKKSDLADLKEENHWKEDVCKLYKTIDIEDTPGIIPVKFQFRAWSEYVKEDILLHPFYYLGLDTLTLYDFSKMIYLDSFIHSLNLLGYNLQYTPNWFVNNRKMVDINSYEEYFNHFKNNLDDIDNTSKGRLLVRVKFKESNN